MTDRRIPPRRERQFTSLSYDLEKLLLGSLVGDGCCKVQKNYINARYQERHSIKQKEYFLWKIDKYKSLSSENYLWYEKTTEKMRYCSRALPDLTILANIVNEKGSQKKLTRKWLNSLTPLSLAILWCDDGSLISNTSKGVFCLDSFSFEEQKIFVRYLKIVWGIDSKIYQNKKGFYRTYLNRENLQKWCRLILPYIPVKSMLYKTTLLYKDLVLQERWISEMIQYSQFSEDEIREIVEFRKTQLLYFRK